MQTISTQHNKVGNKTRLLMRLSFSRNRLVKTFFTKRRYGIKKDETLSRLTDPKL